MAHLLDLTSHCSQQEPTTLQGWCPFAPSPLRAFLPPCVFMLCLLLTLALLSSLPLDIQPTYRSLTQKLPLSWSLPCLLCLHLIWTLVLFIEQPCSAYNFSCVSCFLNHSENFLCTPYDAWFNAAYVLGPQLCVSQMIRYIGGNYNCLLALLLSIEERILIKDDYCSPCGELL